MLGDCAGPRSQEPAPENLLETALKHMNALYCSSDANERANADVWLKTGLVDNPTSWGVCLQLIEPVNVPLGQLTSNDCALFGATVLSLKLRSHGASIIDRQDDLKKLCDYLLRLLFSNSSSLAFGQPQLRSKVADSCALALFYLSCGQWEGAIVDLLHLGTQLLGLSTTCLTLPPSFGIQLEPFPWKTPPAHSDPFLDLAYNYCSLMSALPAQYGFVKQQEWASPKSVHKSYTNISRPFDDNDPHRIVEAVADQLTCLLERISASQQMHDTLKLVLMEAFNVIAEWSRLLTVPLVYRTSRPEYSSAFCQLIRQPWMAKLDASVVAEHINALLIQIQASSPGDHGVFHDLADFQGYRGLIESTLDWLDKIVLKPFLAKFQTARILELHELDNSDPWWAQFSDVVFAWAQVIYTLTVICPRGLLLAKKALSLETLQPRGEVPASFLVQLIAIASCVHAQAHARILNLWNDFYDMANMKTLTVHEIKEILDLLKPGMLHNFWNHMRRDHPQWAGEAMEATDADRIGYVDQCKDCIVTMYFMCQEIDQTTADALVHELLMSLSHAGSNLPLYVVNAQLLEAIILPSFEIDPPPSILSATETLTTSTVRDAEFVQVLTTLVQGLSRSLDRLDRAGVWKNCFEALICNYDIDPVTCASTLLDVCVHGAHLSLVAEPDPRPLLARFTQFIHEKLQHHTVHKSLISDPLLWASLALLIQTVPFPESGELSKQALRSILDGLKAQPIPYATRDTFCVAWLLVRRVAHVLWTFDLKRLKDMLENHSR